MGGLPEVMATSNVGLKGKDRSFARSSRNAEQLAARDTTTTIAAEMPIGNNDPPKRDQYEGQKSPWLNQGKIRQGQLRRL